MNTFRADGSVEIELVYDTDEGFVLAEPIVRKDYPEPDDAPSGFARDFDVTEDELDESIRWFHYETSQNGIADLIGASYSASFWPDPNLAERWLLANGIAPGQRFRVRIQPTEYTGPDHNGEYDSFAGDWEITWIEPWATQGVEIAWTMWLHGQPEGPDMRPPFEEQRLFPDGLVVVFEKAEQLSEAALTEHGQTRTAR